jgi:hypothetical protein
MSFTPITEQYLLERVRRLPPERWPEVLRFVESLQPPEPAAAPDLPPIRTGADLLGSDLIGLWKDRTDIGDSRAFARRLREQAQTRPRTRDAAGHGHHD